MNPKISKGFAFTVIIIIAGTLGALLWLAGERTSQTSGQPAQNISKKTDNKDSACRVHYYEGEAKISSWLVSAEGQDLVVQVAASDLGKLPKAAQAPDKSQVKLIDASATVKKSLQGSSAAKPASITIKGYATTCDSALPSISLQPATVAFKKS